MKHAGDNFLIPLWRIKWAYNFIKSEEEFEDITLDQYADSVLCTYCCGRECDKCSCDWLCCCRGNGNDDDNEDAKREDIGDSTADEAIELRKNATLKWQENESDCAKGCNRIVTSNIFYMLHYGGHLAFRLPLYYVILCLQYITTVFQRVVRFCWIVLYNKVSNCKCCGDVMTKVIQYIFVTSGSVTFLLITGPFAILLYWIDILANAIFFRPILAMGLALSIAMRNRRFEPLQLDSKFRLWVEDVYPDWAWASSTMVSDPDGLELSSTMRNPIVSPKNLLSAFSMLPTLANQNLMSEVFGPFLIQLVILWIVFTNLYIEKADEIEDPGNNLRILAALGAFLYYTKKGYESAGKFAQIAKGHTGNIFLLLDASSNVLFPYFIIPMAVTVVLNSSGLDIVLNLLALDFVTTIDEELYEESIGQRIKMPYCFVFKVARLPVRTFGLFKSDSDEYVLLIDVWEKVQVEERLIHGKDPITTEYWAKNEALSLFQAKLQQGPRLEEIKKLMKTVGWNTCRYARRVATPRASDRKTRRASQGEDAKDDDMVASHAQTVTFDRTAMHLRVTDIPVGVKKSEIIAALEACPPFKSLGKCIGVSYLRPPKWGKAIGRCQPSFKEQKGKASAFFEKPWNLPTAFAKFDADETCEVTIQIQDAKKPSVIKVHPLLPVTDEENSVFGDMVALKNFIEPVLEANYTDASRADAMERHMKLFGEHEGEKDTRVMICYNFPFADEDDKVINPSEMKAFVRPVATNPVAAASSTNDEKKAVSAEDGTPAGATPDAKSADGKAMLEEATASEVGASNGEADAMAGPGPRGGGAGAAIGPGRGRKSSELLKL